MKNLLTTLLLTLIPFAVFASSTKLISGYVTINETNQPVGMANIYINGSLLGTTSDDTGYFKITANNFPCEVVVSYLGYSTDMRKLDCATDTIQFRLVPEPYIMDEFTVTDKSNREAYLKLFKTWFLGNNKWGRKAEILNDSVLVFVKNNAKFTTYATAPIQVHLPLLGYDVLVDMNYLTLEESPLFLSMHCFLSASYFFKELPFESEKQKRKIDKKRALAYYCSPEHFLRSLYNQQLRENGYQVFYTHIKSEPRHKDQLSVSKQNSDDSFEINKIDPGSDDYTPTTDQIKISYLTDKNGIKYGVLKGYKGDGLEILYRHKRGFPVNLNYANSNVYYKSSLYFNDDVCMFRKNGTMFDTSMLFTGMISSKKIGAILPNGFLPNTEK